MGAVSFFITLLVVLLIFMVAVLFVFEYLSKVSPAWPYIFYLENMGAENINVQILVNGAQYKVFKLPPGLKGQVVVGSNIRNPKTGKGFTREEVTTVAFFYSTKPDVEYSSRNVKQAPTFSVTQCQGPNCAKETPSALRAVSPPVYGKIIMSQQGYYTIFF